MDRIQDDFLERINNMISSCRDADAKANETLTDLADQGDQLKNIEVTLNRIDRTVHGARGNISRLKGVQQQVINTLRVGFQRKKISKFIQLINRKSSPTPASTSIRRREVDIRSSAPDLRSIDSSVDGQIDHALCEIGSLLHSLKDKAYVMNDQLVEQADRISYLQEHMIDSKDCIQKLNVDMQKIH